jgi:DinB superfamily
MRYMRLSVADREALLAQLEAMPGLLRSAFAALSPAEAAAPGPGDSFAPVEHCWHLADLEREGYAVRIRRLLAEDAPVLPDFDGARIAAERGYRTRSLTAGIEAFREARAGNVEALRALGERDWLRPGTQDGVGPVTVCDLPAMMAEHDEGHRSEIEAWARARERAEADS